MDRLEVGGFGLVAGLDEGLEASLHQGGDAAAEDGLFAEEVGFGFFEEGGFEHAGAGAADALGVGQRDLFGGLGGVLVDGEQRGDAAALFEDSADQVTGAFGRDHGDVDLGRRGDLVVVDGETVGEHQRLALGH